MALQFGILGPLEVLRDESPVSLPRHKQRAVLAVLLLHRGESVSSDRLVEALWGERSPRTARDALQNYVSLLRKELGADTVVTDNGGYRLAIAAEQLDLERFERLAADARRSASPKARARKLRAALDVWRGPALTDFAYDPFSDVETARLEGLRLAAREDLFDAELELGHDSRLVPELESLIAAHPYNERLRGQLMLALYRAGRQKQALEAYQAVRRILDEELGLVPSSRLRELEQAILRQDPALDAQPVLLDSTGVIERLDAEAAAALLDHYFRSARAVIEGHSTEVEQLVDEAAAAVSGGPPRPYGDDALAAVRAALELRDTLGNIEQRLVTLIGQARFSSAFSGRHGLARPVSSNRRRVAA